MSSAGALRSLFAVFDVSTGEASKKLGQLNAQTTSIKDSLVALGATLLGAFSAKSLNSFIVSQIELGSQIDDTAQRLGVGADELQRWQFQAEMAGVSNESAARSLEFLNKAIGEAVQGGKSQVAMFQDLDIAIKDTDGNVRPLMDLLPELADAFGKMESQQERVAVATKLFGKEGAALVPLLSQGGDEVEALNAKFEALGLGVKDEFIAMAAEAGDELDTLKLGFRALKTSLASELLPGFTHSIKTLQEWVASAQKIAKETNIVKYGMAGMGVAGGAAALKLGVQWGNTLGIFKKGAPITRNLFSLGKLGLTAGLFAGIAVGVEDIVTMCQGGQSVIGDFLTEMYGAEYVKDLVDQLNTAWAQMTPAFEELKPLAKDFIEGLIKYLPYAIGLVTDLLKFLGATGSSIIAIGKALYGLAKGKNGADVADQFMKDTDNVVKLMSRSALQDMINAPPQIPAAQAAPLAALPPGNANVTVNQTNNFAVNGAGDPNVAASRTAKLNEKVQQRAIEDAANALAKGK